MKAFVITIEQIPESVQCAERCIESGKKFGLNIQKWKATTPEDNPREIFKQKGINPQGFMNNVYSREERCMSAFLSHRSLWEHCAKIKEDVLIFEHDAVVMSEIPNVNGYQGCISFGKPSYGKFFTPRSFGVQDLQSKPYFPGAHAYQMSYQAAEVILKKSKTEAAPTDVFLNKNRFRFLQEYYPWPVEVRETFSTIQKEKGCQAKHMYNGGYDLL